MKLDEFQKIVQELQNTFEIGRDPERRRYFYEAFDDLYLFLEANNWDRDNLDEHRESNQPSYFQNNLNYYCIRLSKIESASYIKYNWLTFNFALY